jgi:hypothetical protein
MKPAMVVLVLLAAGCASRGNGSLEGTVRIVGSAPVNVQVVLQPDTGSGVRITGPLLAELERLSGVRVTVAGIVSRSPDPIVDRQIAVADYDILSVDGRPVVTGEIVGIEGERARLRMTDGSEVLLSGSPLTFRVGQKVWVQGVETLAVQAYGIVRP